MWWNEKWGTSSALVFQYVAKGITPATWLLCGMCCNHLATMTQYFSFYTLSCHLFSLFILFICASLQHFPSHSWLFVLHCCPFVIFFFRLCSQREFCFAENSATVMVEVHDYKKLTSNAKKKDSKNYLMLTKWHALLIIIISIEKLHAMLQMNGFVFFLNWKVPSFNFENIRTEVTLLPFSCSCFSV